MAAADASPAALAALSSRLTDALTAVELQRATLEEVLLRLAEQAAEREHERETQHGPTELLPLMREGIADDELLPKSRRYFMCRSGV